jgi:hypothetical protein
VRPFKKTVFADNSLNQLQDSVERKTNELQSAIEDEGHVDVTFTSDPANRKLTNAERIVDVFCRSAVVGSVNIVLPETPLAGQSHRITDTSETSHVLTIRPSGVESIEGLSEYSFTGSVRVHWSPKRSWLIDESFGGISNPPANVSGSYVTATTEATLPNSRKLTAGSGVQISDGGPQGDITVSATGSASITGSFLTVNLEPGLPNSRRFTPATGIIGIDFAPGYIVAINDNDVATITGSRFTGPVDAAGGLTGSLQLVNPTTQYLTGANGLHITTASNGQVTIALTSSFADYVAPYILATNVPGSAFRSNPNNRLLTMGTGMLSTDGGSHGGYNIRINNNVVATISGSRFTGPVSSTGGFTGSHHHISTGLTFLAQRTGITIASASNGQVSIGVQASGSSGISLTTGSGGQLGIATNLVASSSIDIRSGSNGQVFIAFAGGYAEHQVISAATSIGFGAFNIQLRSKWTMLLLSGSGAGSIQNLTLQRAGATNGAVVEITNVSEIDGDVFNVYDSVGGFMCQVKNVTSLGVPGFAKFVYLTQGTTGWKLTNPGNSS